MERKKIEMDKVVLITGAANGLGRALTETYLSHDWRVIATDIDVNGLLTLPTCQAGRAVQKKLLTLPMNITSDESVHHAFAEIEKEKIILDLIINNAGIDCYFPLTETPVDDFKHIFEVNLFGGYRVNQVFLPLLKKPGGRIIHISIESINLTIPFMPYPLTKKAVEGYAKVIRQEMNFLGVDVVLIRPGAIETQLLGKVRSLQSAVSSLPARQAGQQLIEPFKKFAEGASKEIGKTITPEKAASFIYHISTIRNPFAVYRINNMTKLRIAAILPFWLTELLVKKRLKK